MLKMLPLVVALSSSVPVAVVGGLLASRAPPAAEPARAPRTLSVSGDAQIRVVPDKATFSVVVDAADKDKKRAQQLVQERTAAVIAAVTKAGLAPAGVTVANLGLAPEYETDKHGNPLYLRVRRWTASRTLTLCASDLTKMNEIFGAVIDAGGVVQGAVTFDTSRLEELRTEARKRAAQAARTKAAALVDALGGKLGAPASIAEQNPAWSGPLSYKNAVESWENGAFVDGAFAAGQMSLSAHVDVVFDLS